MSGGAWSEKVLFFLLSVSLFFLKGCTNLHSVIHT